MMAYYTLDRDGKTPLLCGDLLEWAKWFEKTDRSVADDTFGPVRVSTVFLGLNHNFFRAGPPVLWETMIFGGRHDEYMERYSSYAQALEGHARAVALVANDPETPN
jgi:hypothetical protein